MAAVTLSFHDTPVTKLLATEDIPFARYVANVGGLLGLAMGASFITVFEVTYALTRLFIIIFTKFLGLERIGIVLKKWD